MVLIRQNEGAKIILHAKSRTCRAAKLKGFTVSFFRSTHDNSSNNNNRFRSYLPIKYSQHVMECCITAKKVKLLAASEQSDEQ